MIDVQMKFRSKKSKNIAKNIENIFKACNFSFLGGNIMDQMKRHFRWIYISADMYI